MKGLGVVLNGLTKGGCMSNRCYLRGTSLLGLFNTVIGCLFNRVLVKVTIADTNEVIDWWWGYADKFPPAVGGENE